MSGVGLQWQIPDFEGLQRRVNALANLDRRGLSDAVGAEVESQFRRRIAKEKTTPAGVPWAPWSEAYAETRHAGNSLLVSENHLIDSMTYLTMLDGSAVDVGSNLEYAAIQNFGGAEVGKPNLPAREYAGLSAQNRREVQQVASDWLDHYIYERVIQ